MSPRASSSPRAAVSALPTPLELTAPSSTPEGSPISGEVARGAGASATRLEQQRDELLVENAALRARLELLSSLERAAWWDWDVKAERLTAHGDLVELVQLDLPADLGAAGLGRWLALLHPEDVRRARSAFARAVSGPGEIAACPLRVRARAGGYRWVLVALTASVDSVQEHSLRVFGAARDIHIEKTAQEGARRNAQVLSAMTAGVVCTDLDGVVRYMNGAAARLLGSQGDCVGRSLFELFPEDCREDLVELVSVASEGGAARHRLEQGAGGVANRSVWLELSSYGDASGKPAGLVCVAFDASDRRAQAPSS
jgi:PAS domain S-box-containing protein